MNWLRSHFVLLCFFLGLGLRGLFYYIQLLFMLGMTLWSSKRLGRHSDFLCFQIMITIIFMRACGIALQRIERASWIRASSSCFDFCASCLLLTGQITRFRVGWRGVVLWPRRVSANTPPVCLPRTGTAREVELS